MRSSLKRTDGIGLHHVSLLVEHAYGEGLEVDLFAIMALVDLIYGCISVPMVHALFSHLPLELLQTDGGVVTHHASKGMLEVSQHYKDGEGDVVMLVLRHQLLTQMLHIVSLRLIRSSVLADDGQSTFHSLSVQLLFHTLHPCNH